MENTTNSPQDSANCTSLVCPDPAHDEFSLHAEWSDEDRESLGDGQPRDEPEDLNDPDDRDVPEDQEDEVEGQEAQDVLLRFSGANAPEILRNTMRATVLHVYVHIIM